MKLTEEQWTRLRRDIEGCLEKKPDPPQRTCPECGGHGFWCGPLTGRYRCVVCDPAMSMSEPEEVLDVEAICKQVRAKVVEEMLQMIEEERDAWLAYTGECPHSHHIGNLWRPHHAHRRTHNRTGHRCNRRLYAVQRHIGELATDARI